MKWPIKSLGTLCLKIGSGVTPKGGDSVYFDDGVALIRSQNVYNDFFDFQGLVHITEEQADRMQGVEVISKDVLLNITGDSVARACQVVDAVLPARVNQHVCIVRPNINKLSPRFLMYYLISPYMQSSMLSLAGSGGTRKALTKAMITAFDIPVPPLTIQELIANILSTYDDLIENNRRRIQLLEESARLLYKEWFIRLCFPGHEHVKIVDGVPEGWEKLPLGQHIKLNYGKALKAEDRIDGPYPVYGSSGIVGTHESPLVAGPGIIIGRKGNVGSVYWSSKDFYPIDTVYFIDAESSNLYLYYALQFMQFISTDVAVPGLNRDLAYSRLLLIPNQQILVAFLEQATPIHQQMDKLMAMNVKLSQARDLLLPRLMNGEISV